MQGPHLVRRNRLGPHLVRSTKNDVYVRVFYVTVNKHHFVECGRKHQRSFHNIQQPISHSF